MRPRHFAFLRNLALFVSLLSVLPTPAQAQEPKRIVVENFRGPAAGRVRSQLLSNLQRQSDLEVVSRADVRSTAQELGIRGRSYSEDEYVQIARELNIAAFVDGRTNRRRRRWALTVRVRSGADGMVLGSESWGGRTVGSLNTVRRNGYTRLEPYISAAQSPAPQQTSVSSSGVTEVAASGDTPWYASGSDGTQDDESVLDLDEDLDDDDFDEPIGDDARYRALRLSAVFGSVYRSMAAKACVMAGLRGGDPGGASCGDNAVLEDRTYSSGGIGHMEAGVEGVIYPGAFGDRQFFPYIGVVASFRHSIAVSTTGPAPDNVDVPTSQSELYIGARGRYRFTEESRGPQATVDLGYGNFSFDLDEEALKLLPPNAVIPPVSYRYLLLGAGFSYGVVPRYLRLGANVSWRPGLGVGNTAKEIWGVETTDMSGYSLGIDATSEITSGLVAELSFELLSFSTTYRGQTACVDPGADGNPDDCSPMDPWEPWPHQPTDPDAVTGGITEPVTDDYYRITLKLGYAL